MLVIPFMEVAIQEAENLGLDPIVFRAFYDDALPRIYGYFLHRVGGSVPVAEDLTQETFLAAVSELRKGRRVEAPIPWIYGIARHKLIHHYRRQERVEQLVTDHELIADDATLDDSGAFARENAVAALAEVPASQRVALVLRHLDGFSVPEIAAALGKSVEAVESLLARGRAPQARLSRGCRMSTADFLTTLAPEFDGPATPRAEFVEGLWSRLDPSFARGRSGVRPGVPRAAAGSPRFCALRGGSRSWSPLRSSF